MGDFEVEKVDIRRTNYL